MPIALCHFCRHVKTVVETHTHTGVRAEKAETCVIILTPCSHLTWQPEVDQS